MPELPEVETVARSLRAPLIGRTITAATVHWPRTVAQPAVEQFTARIAGQQIVSIDRRGKYLVLKLNKDYLLIHLKMSGRMQVLPVHLPQDRHVHVVLDLDDGQQLRFRDVRKFGRVYLVKEPEQVTAGLGPEPLSDDLTLAGFCDLLSHRSGRIKSLLLNQQFLAGIGNIYADESLFAARIHPLRPADSLTAREQAALYHAIRAVLQRAIASQGTTLADGGYTDAEGQPGSYQRQIAVYGRQGLPCPICQAPIERIVIGGRSSHFCPGCQTATP
jgi:formamidopyrimidine-DNA glycosylase